MGHGLTATRSQSPPLSTLKPTSKPEKSIRCFKTANIFRAMARKDGQGALLSLLAHALGPSAGWFPVVHLLTVHQASFQVSQSVS
ncbi:rCG51228, partial [Rattus norvegicus]